MWAKGCHAAENALSDHPRNKSIRVNGLMIFMEFGHRKSISDHYKTTRKPLKTIRIPSETIRISLETIRNH